MTTTGAEKNRRSLLIKGGHLIDPAARIDAPMDVLLKDSRVAEIAAGHGELVRFDALDEALRLKVGEYPGPRHGPVEATIRGRHRLVERGIGRHDVEQRQAVTLRHLVIVEVVRRGDLQAAAAEGRIDVGIRDHRNVASGERQAHACADQVPVALILGVHRHGAVAKQCLGPRGRDHDVARAVG